MKKILLIEDNPEVRENTAEILELSNFDVITAPNGREGVKLAQEAMPDLIICDIMMPELDGYGVLHILGKNPATASIPFIFLTAKAEKSDFRKGMTLGADDYITKPFDEAELLNAVEIRLKKSEMLKSQYANNEEGLNEFIRDARGLEELKKLSQERKKRAFKKKQVIFAENQYPQNLFYINSGKVKTYKSNEDGKDFITGLYGPGDFLGYVALLEETKYAESAEAIEETEVTLIPKEDFSALLHKNRDVAMKFIKLLSKNLKEQEENLLKLAYNSVRKRVADVLVNLYGNFKTTDDKPVEIMVPREDIARMAGTATESVIRVLSDFKDEKLIELKGRKITVLNYPKLSKLIG
jgi:CRP/FNR family transcriptional regulator, polysaccharide utilization system transcription regulator